MTEVHLYGKLRRYAQNSRTARNGVIVLEPDTRETVTSLLSRVEIPVEEINHIFFNGKLLVSRTKAASFLSFTQAGSDLSDWDLNVPVDDGDRIGLFGRDMALLGM
jgi:hypothetical protein